MWDSRCRWRWIPQVWMVIIAVYTLLACQVPVWWIIQPRDFVNVQILYAGMAALVVGLVWAGFQGVTLSYPVSNFRPVRGDGTGLAVSVHHDRLRRDLRIPCPGVGWDIVEADWKPKDRRGPIGYGGMLLEGLLAVLVLRDGRVIAQLRRLYAHRLAGNRIRATRFSVSPTRWGICCTGRSDYRWHLVRSWVCW